VNLSTALLIQSEENELNIGLYLAVAGAAIALCIAFVGLGIWGRVRILKFR